jgi:hypothetical protein
VLTDNVELGGAAQRGQHGWWCVQRVGGWHVEVTLIGGAELIGKAELGDDVQRAE